MGRLIRLDWAIKKLLRDKANFDILEGFLSELLPFDVFIQEILESESNKETSDDKFNRVDILVKDESGRIFIIEVQNDSEADYLQRLVYGTSKAMVEHIESGAAYSQIKKLYSVSIVYFNLGEGLDYLYHGTTSFKGMHKSDDLELTNLQKKLYHVEKPADLLPEYYLIKVPKFNDEIRDTLDEWIYFLKHEEIKDSFRAKGLRAAREKLDILKMSDQERKTYERYLENVRYRASMMISTYSEGREEGIEKGLEQGREEGLEEGIEKGLEQGREEGLEQGRAEGLEQGREEGEKQVRKAMAVMLLDRGFSPEEVAEMAQLTIEDVLEAKKDIDTAGSES